MAKGLQTGPDLIEYVQPIKTPKGWVAVGLAALALALAVPCRAGDLQIDKIIIEAIRWRVPEVELFAFCDDFPQAPYCKRPKIAPPIEMPPDGPSPCPPPPIDTCDPAHDACQSSVWVGGDVVVDDGVPF